MEDYVRGLPLPHLRESHNPRPDGEMHVLPDDVDSRRPRYMSIRSNLRRELARLIHPVHRLARKTVTCFRTSTL
jgi:hypothetical protein